MLPWRRRAISGNRAALAGAAAGGGGGSQSAVMDTVSGASALMTFSNGNKTVTKASGSSYASRISTSALGSGKYYWMWRVNVCANGFMWFGIATMGADDYLGNYGSNAGMGYELYPPNATDGALSNSFPVDIGCHYDGTAKRMWFDDNGSTFHGDPGVGSDNPATGVGGMNTSTLSGTLYPGVSIAETGDNVTLLAGTNITRSPQSGFTVLA